MANMANIWAVLRKKDSSGISLDTLRGARLSLIRRLNEIRAKGGSWEQTSTGVVLSINGVETDAIERSVRIDARALVSAVDKRKV